MLAAVVLVVMSRLLPHRGLLVLDDIWTSDLLNNNVPPRAFLGRELRAGHFPLWLPGSYGGLPLLPQGEAAAGNPITWILYGLFDWVTATNLTVAIHTWVAGFGMLLLARRFGARMTGALVAAIGFMLCGFLVEHVKHVNLHHASVWLPWMVAAADRLREAPTWRSALGLGALAALQITEGHPQMSYIGLFLLLPIFLFRLGERGTEGSLRRARGWLRLLGTGGGSLLVAGLLAGAYLVSGLELLSLSERWADRTNLWDFATRFDFRWENILTLAVANVFGDGANATYNPRHGIFWESWLYVGALPVAALLLALGFSVRHAVARRFALLVRCLFLLSLGGFAFALMTGKYSAVYTVAFRVVPGMTWFRFHHRFALVLEVSLLLCAALGIDALIQAVRRRRGRDWAAALGAICVIFTAGDLVFFMKRHFPAAPLSAAKPPPTVAVLQEHAPEEPWRMHTVFAPEVHVEAFDRARGWSRSLRPFVEQWALLQPSMHLLWGIDSDHGYTSVVPYDISTLLGTHTVPGILPGGRTHNPVIPPDCDKRRPRFSGACAASFNCTPHMARALGAFNVRFVLSPAPAASCRGWKELAVVPSGPWQIHVLENQHWLPRAYVVDEVRDVPSVRAVGDELTRGGVDPARQVLRVVPPDAEPSAEEGTPKSSRAKGSRRGSTVRACAHETLDPNRSRVRCELERPGYLVVAESRYPGRRVLLDGQPVEAFAANGIQLGLKLEAGSHEVIVEYRPGYRWLVLLSALGWLGLVATPCGLRACRLWRARRPASARARADRQS